MPAIPWVLDVAWISMLPRGRRRTDEYVASQNDEQSDLVFGAATTSRISLGTMVPTYEDPFRWQTQTLPISHGADVFAVAGIRVVASEVKREGGTIAHTYGRLPHHSETDVGENIVSVRRKKKTARYTGPSSTTEGMAQKVTGPKTDSWSRGCFTAILGVVTCSSRDRTAGARSSEPMRHSRGSAKEATDAGLARQVVTSSAGGAEKTSRSQPRRFPCSANRNDLSISTPEATQTPTSPRSAMLEAPGGRNVDGAVALPRNPGWLAKPSLACTSDIGEAAVSDVSEYPVLSNSVFQQPGMSRRQSNTFIFDTPAEQTPNAVDSRIENSSDQ
ncbi:hypothetical protein OPT61_g817 [Boeremia exigua]|uniref:Uncharacterized protein n=1 Tax=Boeremia exigua TaxID=749465 RepID=A0ACC2ISH3_9PLEO|nr:hypothetical protein OPT61_g817 [Boeremia exigua]